jgi:hypothetical protein
MPKPHPNRRSQAYLEEMNPLDAFSLHDVLGAAEQIINADTPARHGEVWTLEDEIALILLSLEVSTHNATPVETSEAFVLNHAAPPRNADVPDLIIIGLFILFVFGSIMLVNWYFRTTFGV